MIEFILTILGGYLIGDSLNTPKFAKGGKVEYNGNMDMLKSNVKSLKHHAEELGSELKTNKDDVEAWVVAKSERAATDLSDITHYLDGRKMAQGGMTDYDNDIRQVVLKFLASEDGFKFNLECKEKSYRSTQSKEIEYNGEDYFVEFIVAVEAEQDEDGFYSEQISLVEVGGMVVNLDIFTEPERKDIKKYLNNMHDEAQDECEDDIDRGYYARGGNIVKGKKYKTYWSRGDGTEKQYDVVEIVDTKAISKRVGMFSDVVSYKIVDSSDKSRIGKIEENTKKTINILVKNNLWENYAYETGGKVRAKFSDKVNSISKSLKGTKVAKKYQSDYGVKYSKDESIEAAKRIAGSMKKKYGE